MKAFIVAYLISLGDVFSTLINNLFFFALNGNQSLSGRCAAEWDHWFFGSLGVCINAVALHVFGQENHCLKALIQDIQRGEELKRRYNDGFQNP